MKRKLTTLYAIFACFLLAITTIGATYAYWVASTASPTNAIQTSSTLYSINLQISPIDKYTGFSLIPMNDADVLKGIRNECKDKHDRGACLAYKIRVFGYSEELEFISGYMNINTENMENLSYLVFEEKEEYDETKCVQIEEQNYCTSTEITPMGEGQNLSLGSEYDVKDLNEKNLILVIWLTNLNESQNEKDIGNFDAEVTFQAGNGGEIKGTISSVVVMNPEEPNEGENTNP